MNKFLLFAVLIGAAAAQLSQCYAGQAALCALDAGKVCDENGDKKTSEKEYKSVACNSYIKKADKSSACVELDKCIKAEENKMQEAKLKAFCPADKAKCAGSDTSVNCAAWAKAGECNANPDWMLAKCANSCCPICTGTSLLKSGVCPADADSNLCTANSVEKGVTCDDWATADPLSADSECVKNPAYMNKYCMQSCCDACFMDKDKCPTSKKRCANLYAEQTPEKPLTDDEVTANAASCKKWAAAGECAKNKVWMHENCGKECCPICIPKAPASLPAAPAFAAPVQYYSAPVQWAAPAAAATTAAAAPVYSTAAPVATTAKAVTTTAAAAPVNYATNFGGYGAFGGYGGVMGSFPFRG